MGVWPVASAELSGAVRPLLRPPTSQNAKLILGKKKEDLLCFAIAKISETLKSKLHPSDTSWAKALGKTATISAISTTTTIGENELDICDNLNESKFKIQSETEKCSLILDLARNNKSYNTKVSKERDFNPSFKSKKLKERKPA